MVDRTIGLNNRARPFPVLYNWVFSTPGMNTPSENPQVFHPPNLIKTAPFHPLRAAFLGPVDGRGDSRPTHAAPRGSLRARPSLAP